MKSPKMKKAKFDDLKPWQKRVRIAKDVLARIADATLTPTNLIYLPSFEVPKGYGPSNELRDVVRERRGGCEACAVGAVFLCALDRGDKLSLGEVTCVPRFDAFFSISSVDMRDYLHKYFDRNQVNSIESAFEAVDMCGRRRAPGSSEFGKGLERQYLKLREKGSKRVAKHTQASWVMSGIMKNIIKNRGTFRP
jgi:hypothetical protein